MNAYDHEHEKTANAATTMSMNTRKRSSRNAQYAQSTLYTVRRKDCTDEDIKFYRDTFHEWDEPLFWIHLSADYPFNPARHSILPAPEERDYE